MLLLPEAAGPHDPTESTPRRAPGSIRRTSSVDVLRPDGILGDLVVDARARDLVTNEQGEAVVAGEVRVEARVDGTSRQVLEIAATPDEPELGQLVGVAVGSGFRRHAGRALPRHRDACSLLHLLLDDLPGAALVSGYTMIRAGAFEGTGSRASLDQLLQRADMCAGWADGATMMSTLRATGENPTPMGPPAPVLEPTDDPLAWHEMAALPPHSSRRRRRLDLRPPRTDLAGRPGEPPGPPSGGAVDLDVLFRDSHVDGDGLETVLHEYTVGGSIDGRGRRIVRLTARAQVLPWKECPAALASAGRLVGSELAGLRAEVRRDLVGVSTCTHLNDTLRGLADLGPLLERVRTGTAEPTSAWD